MGFPKFVAGYVSGLVALILELTLFAGSLFLDLLSGIFPESASTLSSMLSTAAKANFGVNLFVGVGGALDLGGMREYSVGFLAGVFTVLVTLGGILNHAAPQIVGGLLIEFITVFIPLAIALVIWILLGRQEYTVER